MPILSGLHGGKARVIERGAFAGLSLVAEPERNVTRTRKNGRLRDERPAA